MLKSIVKLIVIYFLKIYISIIQRLFGIKKNRIIFNSYSGRQYACNPKYISEYLCERRKNKYEIIWALKNAEKYRFLNKMGVKIVEYCSWKRFFYEATAKVSINNIGSFSWLPHNKKQLRINTWHGGGCYKKVGIGESHNDPFMKKSMELTSINTSYMISTSRYFSEMVIPNDFNYHGDVLNIGFPRNDLIIRANNDNKRKIRDKVFDSLDICKKNHIILYAPTWRYDRNSSIVIPDLVGLKRVCSEKFGGQWVVIVRAHDLMKDCFDEGDYIDSSSYPDMQELLVAADILISDYSSCIWDFSLQLNKPCFLFTPDLKNYREKRGFNVDIYEWGFPVCCNDFELQESVMKFNEDEFINKMKKHHKILGSFDDGNACEKIAKVIDEFIDK